jgi:hypothetical protein
MQFGLLALHTMDCGMACKGLRAISYQDPRIVEAGFKLPQTTETLIDYGRVLILCFPF